MKQKCSWPGRSLITLFFISLIFLPTGRARAQKAEEAPVIDEATRQAIDRGLRWLASRQNPDGSWSDGAYPQSTAITALALQAFLAQGHLPGQGYYGPEVSRGLDFLLRSARADGYLVGPRGGNMYAHGLATLTLAELWGDTADERLKPVLERAVQLILRSQGPEGGWRYEPRPTGADISVTILQVMALRAARNAGLYVPDQTLRRALDYIRRCYVPAQGGFTYQPRQGPTGFARTAAGLCVLFLTGEYQAAQIPKVVDYLQKNFGGRPHYWYGHYYAAHALHQVGGRAWRDWYARLRQELLPQQGADGSWFRLTEDGCGPVYQTSIAIIVLSIPSHYLPIFQR
jgi:hypothetical protein